MQGTHRKHSRGDILLCGAPARHVTFNWKSCKSFAILVLIGIEPSMIHRLCYLGPIIEGVFMGSFWVETLHQWIRSCENSLKCIEIRYPTFNGTRGPRKLDLATSLPITAGRWNEPQLLIDTNNSQRLRFCLKVQCILVNTRLIAFRPPGTLRCKRAPKSHVLYKKTSHRLVV